MSAKDGEGEKKQDLGQFVDPFNVLRPLLRTEVHTAENHVDYWKRTLHTSHDEIEYVHPSDIPSPSPQTLLQHHVRAV